MDPLRILVVTTSYPKDARDPSGHFVRAEVRALERQGHEVSVVAPRGEAFGWPGVFARLREHPSRALDLPRELVTMRRSASRVARGARFDRAIAHWGAVTFPWTLGLARETELVSHGGDVRALLALPFALREATVRALLRGIASWRFVSEALREDLARALGAATRARLFAIARIEAPRLDLDDSAPSARDLGARLRSAYAPERRLYVSVGRLVATKRVERAVAYVARVDPSARLLVLGDGPERATIVREARTRGVDAELKGTVSREEALAWIAAADALLHASRVEGLSSVVREAEHLGTRVVYVD